MEILGWIATVLVLAGFGLNALQKYIIALIVWILGDILWIIYDVHIDNPSHAVLSTVIILLNAYGIYRQRKNTKIREQ